MARPEGARAPATALLRWRYGASRVRDGPSPLHLLSVDVAEMVAAQLNKEPPTVAVLHRWVQYKTEANSGATQSRMERSLFLGCGFLLGLPLRPRGLEAGHGLAQMFFEQSRRPQMATQEQAGNWIQARLPASAVPAHANDYATSFSNRQVLVASMCFGVLFILEQVWAEFVAWLRPTHALCRCSDVTGARSKGHLAGADTIEGMRSNSTSSTCNAEGQLKWRTRAQLTAVGIMVSVAATSQAFQN